MKVKKRVLWILAGGVLVVGLVLGGLSIAGGAGSPYPRLIRKPDLIRVSNRTGMISSDQAVVIAENAEGSKALSTVTSVQVSLEPQSTTPGVAQSGPAPGTPFYTVVFDGICLTEDHIMGPPNRPKVTFPNGCYRVHEQGYVLIDAESGAVYGSGAG